MQATSEKMLFQSENYQYMEQVASQCCGGFLRQLLQETTGARMWLQFKVTIFLTKNISETTRDRAIVTTEHQ